ncbi:MAG TPA: hypothetical protein DCQ06_00755, partial [Myxococcales bacterium]|nr:hypothetical protein [Myxococcales bacterium]
MKSLPRVVLGVDLLALVMALGCVCCTSSYPQLQRAKSLDSGEVEVTAAAGVPLADSALRAVLDAAETVASQSSAESADRSALRQNAAQLLTVSNALLVAAPALSTEFNLRAGVGAGFEIGASMSGSRGQAVLKWQFLRSAALGFDAALTFGVGAHINPAGRVWDSIPGASAALRVDSYSRSDVLCSLLFSRDAGRWFSLWAGVSFLYGQMALSSVLLG